MQGANEVIKTICMDELIKILIGALCGLIFMLGLYVQISTTAKSFEVIYTEHLLKIIFKMIIYSLFVTLFMLVIIYRVIDNSTGFFELDMYSRRKVSFLIWLPISFLLIAVCNNEFMKESYVSIFSTQSKERKEELENSYKSDKRIWMSTVGLPYMFSLSLFFLVSFGEVVYFILEGIDTGVFSDFNKIIDVLNAVGILCIAFFVKSFFGTLTVFTSLMWLVWDLLTHGNISIPPLFIIVLELVSKSLPEWALKIYVFFTLIYTLLSVSFYSVLDAIVGTES